jgi:hypothetical protein
VGGFMWLGCGGCIFRMVSEILKLFSELSLVTIVICLSPYLSVLDTSAITCAFNL